MEIVCSVLGPVRKEPFSSPSLQENKMSGLKGVKKDDDAHTQAQIEEERSNNRSGIS